VLAQLRQEGVTIVLVEQVAARTVELADRTYIIRNGLVTASGTRDEISQNIDLAHAYLGV
jgi:branched-chain amino acid transport system ATP-binding protein